MAFSRNRTRARRLILSVPISARESRALSVACASSDPKSRTWSSQSQSQVRSRRERERARARGFALVSATPRRCAHTLCAINSANLRGLIFLHRLLGHKTGRVPMRVAHASARARVLRSRSPLPSPRYHPRSVSGRVARYPWPSRRCPRGQWDETLPRNRRRGDPARQERRRGLRKREDEKPSRGRGREGRNWSRRMKKRSRRRTTKAEEGRNTMEEEELA